MFWVSRFGSCRQPGWMYGAGQYSRFVLSPFPFCGNELSSEDDGKNSRSPLYLYIRRRGVALE